MPDNFENLQCWQACYKLKGYIKKSILPNFPKSEKFELFSQLLRASRSATANIAEGWGRYHYKDNIEFLINARGSVTELVDHTFEAKDSNYITELELKEISTQTDSCNRLNGYIKYLRKQIGGEDK